MRKHLLRDPVGRSDGPGRWPRRLVALGAAGLGFGALTLGAWLLVAGGPEAELSKPSTSPAPRIPSPDRAAPKGTRGGAGPEVERAPVMDAESADFVDGLLHPRDFALLEEVSADPGPGAAPQPVLVGAPATMIHDGDSLEDVETITREVLDAQLDAIDAAAARLGWSEQQVTGLKELLEDARDRDLERRADGGVQDGRALRHQADDDRAAVVELIGADGAEQLTELLRQAAGGG